MKFNSQLFLTCIIGFVANFYFCYAEALIFPLTNDNVVGEIKSMVSKKNDNFAQICRDFDMGYMEMLEANPGIDPEHLKPGTVLIIPNQFILPNAPHNGIVINLAEMRLYFYPNHQSTVITYPIGVGREGEETIVGVFKIIQHRKNPTWVATDSMRKLRAAEGVQLPKSVPPGPDNPLGHYAMRLSRPTYLIHGTNDPLGGIGRRSSSGCMRLYPEDIEALFYAVSDGTPVYIIDEPFKAGWLGNHLYIESHMALQENDHHSIEDTTAIRNVIQLATKRHSAIVDWNKVFSISSEEQGIPQLVGVF